MGWAEASVTQHAQQVDSQDSLHWLLCKCCTCHMWDRSCGALRVHLLCCELGAQERTTVPKAGCWDKSVFFCCSIKTQDLMARFSGQCMVSSHAPVASLATSETCYCLFCTRITPSCPSTQGSPAFETAYL